MKTIIKTKIVKMSKDNSTATMTRDGNRVFAMRGASTIFDKVFNSVGDAKRFMGLTVTI